MTKVTTDRLVETFTGTALHRREHFGFYVTNKPADVVGSGSGNDHVRGARVGRVLEPEVQVLLQTKVRQQQGEY